MMLKPIFSLSLALMCALSFQATAYDPSEVVAPASNKAISLRTMGSFAFGGSVLYKEDGTTFHGDHGYAQYYIPSNSRHLPIVMWHGIGQSGKTYESTPDGREGFQALMPRDDWSVYIVDQPRRGRADYTAAPLNRTNIPTLTSEAGVLQAFRNGPWTAGEDAQLFANSAFPLSPEAVEQFFRQQTPDTGEEPQTYEYRKFIGQTGAALFESIGDGILITHSNSGQYGWEIAMASDKVKAVIAFEPGACAFPESEKPQDFEIGIDLVKERLEPRLVSDEDFEKLTQIPILIIFGDNIADTVQRQRFNAEVWRVALKRAYQFAALINAHGGDAQVIELPNLGLKGNTHAAFADTNNQEVLKVVEDFLAYKNLDGYSNPHLGPVLPKVKDYTIPLSEQKAISWD